MLETSRPAIIPSTFGRSTLTSRFELNDTITFVDASGHIVQFSSDYHINYLNGS
ncbi:MAG: hypothetical protein ACTS45_00535 [Candidatus Hodgkinia cicadicola]